MRFHLAAVFAPVLALWGQEHTSITVTATISSEAPAETTTLERKRIASLPGVNLDDRLRQVPGFTLFRRSSSLTANPTTQGVSLRGLGSSGASRTLVLWDGVPVNDPFGGWVYWTRIAPSEIDRVEISRGAPTSIFGDRALAGVISIFSRVPEGTHVAARYEAGNYDTYDVSTDLSKAFGDWAVSGHGRAFTTDGYFIVPQAYRGPVDRPASLRFVAGDARLDRILPGRRLFLKFDMLAEDRGNGTVLQRNSTSLGTLSAHYDRDTFSLLAWHFREQYHQSFSAISADRRTERLTAIQSIPTTATGASAFWRKPPSTWNLLAGGDFTGIEAGNRQHQQGLFAQTDAGLGPARFYAGARAHRTGPFSFFSPSGGVAVGLGRLRVRGSIYRGFRAATLNELYRDFRVGNAVTLANDRLRPESVFGAEAGFDFAGASLTFFRSSLSDLITNVTLSIAPNLIRRQRQNAASALARGIDFQFHRSWRSWTGELGYLFADSRFVNRARLPQVPRHQGSAQLTWSRGATLLSAGLRTSSFQYEDELNLFLIPGYASVQAVASRRLTAALTARAAIENALDRRILAGFTPTPALASPRLWRLGLHWEIP